MKEKIGRKSKIRRRFGVRLVTKQFLKKRYTLEEYFELLEKQAPRAIARQKLLDAFGQEYCEENGLTFTKVNPPAEMVEAREAYVDELMTKAAGEITYYTD